MLTKHILLLFALSVPLTIFIDVGGATPEETTQSNTNNLACPTGTQQYVVNNPNFNKAQYIVTFGLTGDYITFFTFSGPSGTIRSWKATTPIKEIIMKGGKSGATVYTFDTGTKAGGPLHTTLMNTKSYGSISKIFICVPPPPVIIEMCLLKAIDDIDYSWTLTVHNSSVSETTASVVEEHLEDNIELVKVTTVTHKVYGHFNVNNPSFLCFPKLKDISVWIGTHQVTATCNPVWFGFILSKIVECDFSGSFTGDKPSDVRVEVKIDPKTTCVSDNTATTPITVWSPPCEEKDKCVSCVTVTSESKDVVIVNGIQKNICNPPNLGSMVARIPVLSVPRPCVVFTVKVGTCPSMTMSFCVSLPQLQQEKPFTGSVILLSANYTSRYVWDYTRTPQTGCISGEMCTQIESPSLSSYVKVTSTDTIVTYLAMYAEYTFFNPNDIPIHIDNVILKIAGNSFDHLCVTGPLFPTGENLDPGATLHCPFNGNRINIPHPSASDILRVEVVTTPAWAGTNYSVPVIWNVTKVDYCSDTVFSTSTPVTIILIESMCADLQIMRSDSISVLVQQKEDLIVPFHVEVVGEDTKQTWHSDDFNLTFCGKVASKLVISPETPIFSQQYIDPNWAIMANPPITCVTSSDSQRAMTCLGQFVSLAPDAILEPKWVIDSIFTVSNPDAHCPAIIKAVYAFVDRKKAQLRCFDWNDTWIAPENWPYTLPSGSFISCNYATAGPGSPSIVEISVTVTNESLVAPPSNTTMTPESDGTIPENSCVMIGLTKETAVKWCNASSPLPCIPVNETFGGNSTTDNTCFTYRVYIWNLELTKSIWDTDKFQFCFCPSCSCVHDFNWWKTHQDKWPELVTTPFFCSEKTWGDVAEITGKEARLCYWTMAKYYLAAKFNILRGTCLPSEIDVPAQMTVAQNYLNNNTLCDELKCHVKPPECLCGGTCQCFPNFPQNPLSFAAMVIGLYSQGTGAIPGSAYQCPPGTP